MWLKRFFVDKPDGNRADEVAETFKLRANDYITQGNQQGLRDEFVKLTSEAMMTDGQDAIYPMRSAMEEVIQQMKQKVKRGKFDHLRPRRFKNG
jgi:hypothetical protein